MKPFKKGDICICRLRLYRRLNSKYGKGKMISEKNLKVRIIKIKENQLNPIYSVFNLKYKRYECISEYYLTLDIEESREVKIKRILN